MNFRIFAVLVALATVRAFAASSAPLNHWEAQRTTAVAGAPNMLAYQATITLESQAGGSSITFSVSVTASWDTSPNPSDAAVRVGLNNGSSTVYANSNGKINIGGSGTYTVVVEVNNAGAWSSVAPSANSMLVAIAKTSGFQTRQALIDLHYRFYDKSTGKLVSDQFVPAGESPYLNLSNTGSGLDYQVVADGKVWNSTTGQWEDSSTQNTIVGGGTIGAAAMVPVGGSYATPTAGVSATGDGGNAFVEGNSSVVRGAPPGVLVGSTSTSGVTGQESATNTNAIVNALYDATGRLITAVNNGQTRAGGVAGGGGGGGGTSGAVHDDVVAGKLQTISDTLGSVKATLRPESNPHEDPSADLTAAATAAAAASTYDGPSVSATDTVTTPSSSGTVSNSIFSVNSGGFAVALRWDEYVASSVLGLARTVILYALAVGFIAWCGIALHKYLVALPMIPQAEGNVGVENLVPGVAQAKSLGAAGAIVLAVVTAAAALVVIVDTWASNTGGVHITTVLSRFSGLSVGSGLELVDRVYPVWPSFQFVLLRAVFHYAAIPLYLACASLVKFIRA